MLEQTKNAYAAMTAAGFKRGEFFAQAERTVINSKHNGRYVQYGPCTIGVWSNEKAVACTAAMRAQGLSVELLLIDGFFKTVIIRNDGRGRLMITNIPEEGGRQYFEESAPREEGRAHV